MLDVYILYDIAMYDRRAVLSSNKRLKTRPSKRNFLTLEDNGPLRHWTLALAQLKSGSFEFGLL